MNKIFSSIIILLSFISVVQSQVSQTPYSFAEVMPVFRGGPEAMYKFISANSIYPDSAREKGIEGFVIVSFVVDVDSLAKEVIIMKGIGGGCDEEVRRMFVLMNEQKLWIPGRHNDKAVPVMNTIPVRFVLPEKDKKSKEATLENANPKKKPQSSRSWSE